MSGGGCSFPRRVRAFAFGFGASQGVHRRQRRGCLFENLRIGVPSSLHYKDIVLEDITATGSGRLRFRMRT